jgi:hypothetical protein
VCIGGRMLPPCVVSAKGCTGCISSSSVCIAGLVLFPFPACCLSRGPCLLCRLLDCLHTGLLCLHVGGMCKCS